MGICGNDFASLNPSVLRNAYYSDISDDEVFVENNARDLNGR